MAEALITLAIFAPLFTAVLMACVVVSKRADQSTQGGEAASRLAHRETEGAIPSPAIFKPDWRAATERVERIHADMLREIRRGMP